MSRVTSKLQVTIPKAVADRYRIRPGDELDWLGGGEAIRVVPRGRATADADRPARRLELFDRATERQREREEGAGPPARVADRGWTREELYVRGRPG